MLRRSLSVVGMAAAALGWWCLAGSMPVQAWAQDDAAKPAEAADAAVPTTDPAATKAFGELLKAYRGLPGLEVKTTLKISGTSGQANSAGNEVKAEYVFGKGQMAVVKIKGYTCYLAPVPAASLQPGEDPHGTITAVHEKNESAYFTGSDDGSPYYALMNQFSDLPYPELALELGFDSVEDVLMQFHPKAPDAVPTATDVQEKDGRKLRHIRLNGVGSAIDILADAKTNLIESIEVKLTGGDFVQPGTTLTYSYAYENKAHQEPMDPATFEFDPKTRQRTDLLMALAPRPERGQPNGIGPGDPDVPAANALEGKPAPEFTLATADGKAIDLEKLRGRVVVLDFWATWCGPCRAALPMLHQVAKWAADNEMPVTVVTINVWEIQDPAKNNPDARLESAKKFWSDKNFTLPIAMDYSDETARAYGVTGIPMGVIIRADGVVHKVHVGAGGDYVEQMKADIKEAIAAVEAKKN